MTTLLTKYVNRLQQADQLIRLQATGTPVQFALRLDISKSHLFNVLEELRSLGMPLEYDKQKQTYFYTQPMRLKWELSVVPLSGKELSNTNGGTFFSINQLQSNFIRLEPPTFVPTISCNKL
jgi:predicted DNA-binding transcriptional regulator YafY